MTRDHLISKVHLMCFACRRSVKRYRGASDVCPECGGPMHNMGYWFRPPQREAIQQWRKVALLVQAGLRFPSCGCNGCRLKVQVNTLADGKRVAQQIRDDKERQERKIGQGIEYKSFLSRTSWG